jgi:hypothetical protein
VAARSVSIQAQLRDVEIDRRLRGRSEMEAELRGRGDRGAARRARARRPRAAEDLLAREEAHVAQIDRLTAQLDGLVGKEAPRRWRPARHAALEIAQKTSALEALGPIAKEPRARERLEVEVRDRRAPRARA